MKKAAVLTAIKENKEINKNMAQLSYYSAEQFLSDCQKYIKAIREGRMINSIGSVSSSGMSRTVKFSACEKSAYKKGYYNYYNFYCLFVALGFKKSRKEDYFNISGCGMDMIFHTNYTIINRLKSLGFINDELCRILAQMTPTTI
jgi:hypothetical protein